MAVSTLGAQARKAAARTRTPSDDVVLTTMVAFVIASSALIVLGEVHVVLALGVLPLAVAVVWLSPRRCIYALVVWTVCLGFLRRVVPGGASASISGDPLVLIAPFVIVVLLILSMSRGSLRGRSPMANAVALLSIIALIESANPLQGSYKVGLGGILYILVPMLAFWIGRSFVDRRDMRRILSLVAVLATLNAIYGLFQTLVGFPPWDLHWIKTGAYTALSVASTTRAFGSFASSAEYADYLGMGALISFAIVLHHRRARVKLVALGALLLIGTALVLESSRGAVVLTLVGMGVVVAARAGRKLGGAALACIVVIGLLMLVAGELVGSAGSAGSSTSAAAPLVHHLLAGISDPGHSDLPGKFTQMLKGMAQSVTNPLGYGTGAVTIAAAKFGTSSLYGAHGTQVDLSSASVAWGIVGLLVYLVVLVRGITGSYGLALRRRDVLSLATLGIIVASMGRWLNGDFYSVTWVVWLVLGWVDAQNVDEADRAMRLLERQLSELASEQEPASPSLARSGRGGADPLPRSLS